MIGEEKGSAAISGRSSHKMTGLNRFNEQKTTLNEQTKFYLFLNMVMVPRNSTPGGFAYIRHSKRVMIAIKTERTQIHFKRRSGCRRVVGS